MKVVAIILLACVSCIAGLWVGDEFSHTDGRPGCQLPVEFEQKWRNNFDNVRYWVCTANGAVSYICPIEYLFSFERQCCIRWNFWVWTPPFDPPTQG
ncbi:hypothetical protein Bhyg_11224 [Pseudolycoriella hygida]|uniref:Chitin-binding type-2 domain-containing protein n=1 Tax=Pseudolycoriella hygida TaxID=35572 RepID=A0A9Q0MVV5_9DIPT|nr:hypothetical protein Bhyg_11224 [Pseudolycoriella hygida]